jgi:Asp-tRNA(Asn)/Glu-tRNA(Gln) amidotransferase A subunit family amidase
MHETLPRRLGLVIAALGGMLEPVHAQPAVESATIEAVAQAFADGSLTCRALVQGYLLRIEAYDKRGPALNALITVHPRALAEAEAMDVAYRRDRAAVGPLHCVPVVLKDNYDTADLPTTGGSRTLAGSRPTRDAFTVKKLRDAGALILGKANLQELAMGGTTVSSLGGQTRNPYDLTRTPGGSSGGTGAAIAAGFGLAGTGTDTGQSIRSPASANNLVGLRPTRGLVSRRGIIPVSATQDEGGPITRTVADAARMLDVMAGYDPDDPITAAGLGHVPPTYTAFLDKGGLRGARIGVLREYFGSEPVHAEVNRVMARAIAALGAHGAHVEDVMIPGLAELTADMATGPFETSSAFDRYLQALGPAAPVKALAGLLAEGRFHPAIGGQLKEAVANVAGTSAPEYAQIFVRRDRLRVAVLEAMARQRLDVLLYPHQRRLVAAIGDEQRERNGVLSSGTGFPAITLPAGFSAPGPSAPLGVPIGLELLGREWSEGTLVRIGYAFEQATGHRTLPASTPPLSGVRPGANR